MIKSIKITAENCETHFNDAEPKTTPEDKGFGNFSREKLFYSHRQNGIV